MFTEKLLSGFKANILYMVCKTKNKFRNPQRMCNFTENMAVCNPLSISVIGRLYYFVRKQFNLEVFWKVGTAPSFTFIYLQMDPNRNQKSHFRLPVVLLSGFWIAWR